MPLTDADLLASLRDFSQCNETLICKVRTTVLEPFQPDVRPEALSRAVKPSSAEFKTMTVRLAPLAMRIMNENINSLRRLKESRQEKLYNRSAIVTCLIDTSLYAFAALKHMNAYTTLKPLDLEKTMSNLIGKIVDLGEYGRALEELRKFRTNLANIANVQFDSHPPMSSKSKLVSPVSASPRASKGVLTEMLNRGNDDLRMTVSDTWMGKHGHMSSWDDDMLQKYGDLFNFPLDPSINNPTMILLVLAYQMNSLRCWCDIKDGALLKYLPMLLSRSGNFLDCCALLKKFDPITSRKQFDSLQRMLFRAASKFPSSEGASLQSFCLQVLALKAAFYTETASIQSLCSRLVRMGIAYEHSTKQPEYAVVQKCCSDFLEIIEPNSQNIPELDAYFVLCEYYAYVSRKAKSYKGAFYAYKHMMQPLRRILQENSQCKYYHTAYAANAKLALGSVQIDKMVIDETYADITTTLNEICSCSRMVSAAIENHRTIDDYTEIALKNLVKSINGFRQSCNRLYDFIQKKTKQRDTTMNDLPLQDSPTMEPSLIDDDSPCEKLVSQLGNALQHCSELLPDNLQLLKKKSWKGKSKQISPSDLVLSHVDIMILLARMHFQISIEDTYQQAYEYLATAEQLCTDTGFSTGYRWLSGEFYAMGAKMAAESMFSTARYPLRKACVLLEKDHHRINTDSGRLQLCKRYEILGTCCQKDGRFEEAVKAYRLALKRLPACSIEEFVKYHNQLAVTHMIDRHPFVPKLIDRFLRTSIIDPNQESLTLASEIMDLSSLDSAQRCIIQECELKVIHFLSLKMDLSKLESTLVNSLLHHYSAKDYPIRRARVVLEKIRVERGKPEATGPSSLQSQLQLGTEASELLSLEGYGNDDNLLRYRRHYLGLAYSWIGICRRELDEDSSSVFVKALHQWGTILRNVRPIYNSDTTSKEDLKHVCTEIDDIDRLYGHLRVLADLFAVNRQLTYQVNALRLLLKLNNGLREASADHISSSIIISATIGRIYSELGYSGKAVIEFSQAKSAIQSKPCSEHAELAYLVSYAYHLALLRNYEKSKQIFNSAKAIWQVSHMAIDDHPYRAAKFHLSNSLMLVDAYFIRSVIASQAENLDQAISDCNMALKNLNQCAQSIKRNRESKMDTLTLTDPFADDSKDTAARKQSESIVATAVQVAFKESQWGIAWKMNACFERLGSLHMTRGSWRDAQYYFDQGRLLGEQLKSDAMKYHFMLSLSDAYLRCADLNHCASQLEEASNIQPHGFAYIREEADLKMANGELDAIRNYLDQAIESYDRADELFQKLTDSGYIATLENLIESDDEIQKLSEMASEAHSLDSGLRDTVQFECRPLQSMRGSNIVRKALITARQESPSVALNILEKLEESGVMPDEVELNAAIAHIRLLLVRQELMERSETSSLYSNVLTLPALKIQQRSSVAKRTNLGHDIRVIRDNLTHALERILDAHRTGATNARIRELHNLCIEAGRTMFLKHHFSANGRLFVNNYAALSAYYLEMAKSISIRREMQACLDSKLSDPRLRTTCQDQWPKDFHEESADEDLMELEEPRQLFNNPPWIQTWLHQLRNQYSVEHELDDGEFQENFVDIIPEPWTVCCLTMDIHHDDLYLVRLRAGESPFVVKLPLNRLGWRSGAETVNGIYENAATEFKEIIQQSDDTIHSSATYMENNDVDGWWKQRMALDQRLKMLLTSIEHDWFGGFKGLLCGQYQEDEEALSQLCQMVTQLVYKAAYNITDDRSYSNKKCININSTICRMLVRLGPDPSSQDLQDVIYYLLSCYENQDVIVQYSLVDMPQLQEQFASAIRRYHQKARKAGVDPMQRLPNDHVILILDKYTQVFPLESLNIMRNQSVSRLPCLSFLRDRIQYVRAFTNHQVNTEGEQPEAWTDLCVDRDSAFYILNPTGDLKHTQNEFESLFNNMKGWTGLVEKRPMEQECRHALRSKDLYMYFGHSAGQSFIRGQMIRQLPQCSVALLFGCSSGALGSQGEYDPQGYVLNFLMGGSPAVVANLWDVTDKSIDQVSKKMMEAWGLFDKRTSSCSLIDALNASRNHCNLPYLIGAAPVVYGIPVYLKPVV